MHDNAWDATQMPASQFHAPIIDRKSVVKMTCLRRATVADYMIVPVHFFADVTPNDEPGLAADCAQSGIR